MPVRPRAPASVARGLAGLALAITALAAVAATSPGCPAREDAAPSTQAPSAQGPGLPPALAAWFPAEPATTAFRVAWAGGSGVPLVHDRVVRGWEELHGVPHLRVEVALAYQRRPQVYVVEWFRADGEALLCAQRQVGRAVHALVPPQPVLVAPLETGRTWTWRGLAGDLPCSATFRVRARRQDADGRDLLLVEQVTVTGEGAGGLASTRVQTYARGVGLVAEEGSFPTPEGGTDSMVSDLAPPSPAE